MKNSLIPKKLFLKISKGLEVLRDENHEHRLNLINKLTMHSYNNDAKSDTDVDNKLHMRQTNTPPTNSNSSQPSSPSCSTLLVIDDTSNSEDETINNKTNNHTNNIPIKLIPASTAQMPTTSPPSIHDNHILNDTVNQQRRRNSSIAKLLGGRPLRNQQYEEIHQQILDSQSAQNVLNNNDNGSDSGIPRARSSITRTLLMNAERTNSMTKLPPKPPVPSTTSFPKDFEYLIRRELDKVESEHGTSTLQRNNSTPKVVQILNSSSNTNAQIPIQSKLKRKRPISKPPLPPSTISNIPPFSLHDPFEIESSTTNPIPSIKYPHFDSSKRPRYPNPQQYHASMNNSSSSSSSNQSLYVYPNKNPNSTVFNQFNIHQDQTPSNTCLSSCNCSHYSPPMKLPPSSMNNIPITPIRKAKSMLVRPDTHERPRQRSYSNLSDSSSETSPKTTVPLKKRLIDAYNNEHHPTSSL